MTESKRRFVWRGIRFAPPAAAEGPGGFYSNIPISIGEDERAADWKVCQTRSTWYARLRIGADRFPGVGATREAALDAAAAEAQNVAAFIMAMLPPTSSPTARRSKGAPRRAPRKG